MFEPKTETLNKKRVLLIEDIPGNDQLLEVIHSEAVRAQFFLEHERTLTRGLERLKIGLLDLVLLDLSLPDSDGPETFSKAYEIAPHVPIIVLSGLDDEDLAIKTVQNGAQDYLVKEEIGPRSLLRSMRYAIKRKKAEAALSQERDLLHTLMVNTSDRIYFKDKKSRFLRLNPGLAAHFGLTDPDQAVGKTDFDFFTSEHAQAAFDDEQRIIQTGRSVIGIMEKETHPDGRVTWAFTSKMPLRDKQGKIIGTFGVSRDITEIKNVENALAAERNLLRNLIDNLPDYIYVKDAEGRYLLDNSAHRRFVGAATHDEVLGKTPHAFFPPDLAKQFVADDQRVLRSGEAIFNHERPVVDRAGVPYWHSTTKVPLRDADGKVSGVVCISRDVTYRKEAEERLKQANAELVRRREELLEALTELKRSNEELKSTQFQLIQAAKLEIVGTFAAGVAHEVKNPLQTILMGVDFLSANQMEDRETVCLVLNDVRDAVRRADSIVRDLLEFSAAQPLDLQDGDLNRVIEKSLQLSNYELTRSRVNLVKALAPTLPAILLDKHKIEQVFINIFMNAVHAMPEGGTLTIRTAAGQFEGSGATKAPRQFKTGDTIVVVEVDDTGTGIPEANLGRIFDPFFTTKPSGKGTGLGLPVTKSIVELHSGTIDIRNRPAGGVCVTMLFKAQPGSCP